jgi:hypothetical protein
MPDDQPIISPPESLTALPLRDPSGDPRTTFAYVLPDPRGGFVSLVCVPVRCETEQDAARLAITVAVYVAQVVARIPLPR